MRISGSSFVQNIQRIEQRVRAFFRNIFRLKKPATNVADEVNVRGDFLLQKILPALELSQEAMELR